jgi:hypothetical protein
MKNQLIQDLISSNEINQIFPSLITSLKGKKTYFYTTAPSFIEFNSYHEEYLNGPYDKNHLSPHQIEHVVNNTGPLNVNYSLNISSSHGLSLFVDQHNISEETFFSVLNSILDPNFSQYDEDNDEEFQISYINPGLRYLDENILIFEMPPSMRHITYKEAYRENDSNQMSDKHFYIPLPWQVYIATFDSNKRLIQVQMYFTNGPLTSFQQEIYLPPMLNFYSNGVLCRPFFESMEDIEKYPKNINGIIASAYDWIWNSGYNFDITESISEFCHNRFSNFTKFVPETENTKQLINYINIHFSGFKNANNSVPPSIVSHFYSLWEKIPLSDVSKIEWLTFCVKTQFFNHEISVDVFPEILHQYLEDNSLILVEDYDEGDPDDGYITFDDLLDNSSYKSIVKDNIYNIRRNLFDALSIATNFVQTSGLAVYNDFDVAKQTDLLISNIFLSLSSQ